MIRGTAPLIALWNIAKMDVSLVMEGKKTPSLTLLS